MADSLGNEIPLRVRFVKGHLFPEHPENCEPHTPGPEDLEWHQEMWKTHNQRQCKSCGLWAVWEPKQEAP